MARTNRTDQSEHEYEFVLVLVLVLDLRERARSPIRSGRMARTNRTDQSEHEYEYDRRRAGVDDLYAQREMYSPETFGRSTGQVVIIE